MLGENGGRHEWLPAVDIRETEKEYVVAAELPGIRREDVRVRLEDNVLTVEGERRQEKETKGERMHRIERVYGSFQRRFTLPDDADAGNIHAESKDGVLTVHVAKRQVQKPTTWPATARRRRRACPRTPEPATRASANAFTSSCVDRRAAAGIDSTSR